MKKIEITPKNKINRRFTPEWSERGTKHYQQMAEFGNSLIRQRGNLVNYIELLHNEIDRLLEENAKLRNL